MQQQGTFGWNELMTTDVAKSKAFFSKLIGWTTSEMPMPGGQGTYTLLHCGGKPVAGMMPMTGDAWKGVPAHWMAYIAVDDVDRLRRPGAGTGRQGPRATDRRARRRPLLRRQRSVGRDGVADDLQNVASSQTSCRKIRTRPTVETAQTAVRSQGMPAI